MSAIPGTMRAARYTLTTVRLAELSIDPRVQREEGTDGRRVANMVETFDPDALGVIVVSVRENGEKVILDGAHRASAARQVKWTTPLDAQEFTGLTLAEEAAIFLHCNAKKDPSTISKFRARQVLGDPAACEIAAVLAKHGYEITASSGPGHVKAAAAVERVYTKGSGTLKIGTYPEVLDRTFATIAAAWGHDDESSVHQHVIEGLAQLFARMGSQVDPDRLVRTLQAGTPRQFVGKAKGLKDAQGGTVPAAFAKVVHSHYNNRKRTGILPDWVWTR